MTTDRKARHCDLGRMLVAGKLLLAVLVWLPSGTLVSAAEKSVHWHHAGAMPPGAIGRQRLLRGGALSGACQPVEIRAPQGARIAPAAGTSFQQGVPDRLLVGLTIGPVYRFRVTQIPENPGLEVFPTVELIDRLYPPPGQSLRFPVPIELTLDELLQAAEGRFITRVIYVEDPQLAPAIAREDDEQPWVEARPGDDPLVTADSLGRPIAILRLGGRVPERSFADAGFTYGSPQAVVFDQPPPDQGKPKVDFSVQQAVPGEGLTPGDELMIAPVPSN